MLWQIDSDVAGRGPSSHVTSSQHGLNSLATDVAAVKACMARVSSPVVLVGHSYGGTVITHAGTDPRVAAIVYIAALAPDADETSQSHQNKFPKTDVFAHIEVTDGRIWLKPSGVPFFCGDLPEAEQKLVYATQGVPVPDLFDQKHDGVAWKTKPSWYIVGAEDRTVLPNWNASPRNAWAPPRWSCPAGTSRCCPSRMPCST
jgi:pimeloyl-ACP methyl ester carboxylesterase